MSQLDTDILYTPEEIAQKLKITKNTVYEMIKRGDLDAHRIGKHLRISAAQFEIYLLRSKGSENNYDSLITVSDDETTARIGAVSLYVDTALRGPARVSIRPEDIILSKGTFISSARNIHKGIVADIFIQDSTAKVVLDIGIPLVALITKKSLTDMSIEKGCELYAVFKAMAVKIYK